MPSPSKEDWKDRIEPYLSSSLDAVSEEVTQSEPVQTWLRRASTDAAENLGRGRGMQAEMQGYARMMNDLEETLPELMDAVAELTADCGRIDLEWHSLRPTLSQLYVDFDRDIEINLFVRLSECTTEAAQECLGTIMRALPEGAPYPNRPNTVTGLVARDGQSVGVRVKEYLQEDHGRRRSVTLLPAGTKPLEKVSNREATRQLLVQLCPNTSSR